MRPAAPAGPCAAAGDCGLARRPAPGVPCSGREPGGCRGTGRCAAGGRGERASRLPAGLSPPAEAQAVMSRVKCPREPPHATWAKDATYSGRASGRKSQRDIGQGGRRVEGQWGHSAVPGHQSVCQAGLGTEHMMAVTQSVMARHRQHTQTPPHTHQET